MAILVATTGDSADADPLRGMRGGGLGEAGRRLVAQVRAAQVAERRAYADGLVALADLAALVETRRPFGTGIELGEYLAQVVAFELGISTRAAMERLGRAWALQRLPRTLAGLRGGWLGIGAAIAMVASTAGVEPDRVGEVERRVFDAFGGRRLPDGADPLGTWGPADLASLADRHPGLASDLDAVSTPAWVRARCRTAVKAVDPAALQRQVRASRSRREVRVWDADEPGLAWLALLATQAEVTACYQALDTEAHRRHRATEADQLVDPRTGELPTLANTRADVMVDRLLGPNPDGTPGTPVNLTVHVVADPVLPLSARSGAIPAGDVRVDHLGPVVREALDDLLRLAHTSGGRPTRVRLLHPATCAGHPAGSDPGPYRPSTDLAAHVVARDVTCRFPGCAVPAQNCDLDHTIAWPTGPTCICNLSALCRRHHRVKTLHPGWQLTNHGVGGRLTWTTPTGRTIDTHPGRGSPETHPP